MNIFSELESGSKAIRYFWKILFLIFLAKLVGNSNNLWDKSQQIPTLLAPLILTLVLFLSPLYWCRIIL